MIDISRLLCGSTSASEHLRYRPDVQIDRKPVIVWNSTNQCNLRCAHCYAHAQQCPSADEFSTEEARALINDVAAYGSPVMLFSGGEPTLRSDLVDLGAYAVDRGMRAVISTNGTLISPQLARAIKQADFSYVGVSLDGRPETNDKFRGAPGAYERALTGIRNCLDAGVKVGLRFTISRRNAQDIEAIFDLLEEESIPRCCIYHLVYAGRGSSLMSEDQSHEEARQSLDTIFRRTQQMFQAGSPREILTVDNHADGPYLYLTLQREDPQRAEKVLELLRWNGGNSSGIGIACVDHRGDVHPDQFWSHYTLGNVRERPFSEIWSDESDPVLHGLRHRKDLIKGRCAACRFFDVCNGNMRVRAEAALGDLWASAPACYLTDEEIGIA